MGPSGPRLYHQAVVASLPLSRRIWRLLEERHQDLHAAARLGERYGNL